MSREHPSDITDIIPRFNVGDVVWRIIKNDSPHKERSVESCTITGVRIGLFDTKLKGKFVWYFFNNGYELAGEGMFYSTYVDAIKSFDKASAWFTK